MHYESRYRGEIWKAWQRVIGSSRGVVFQSNSVWAITHAIREGYGIGLMPISAAAHEPTMVVLPIEIGPPIEIWVVSYEETSKSRRIRATLDFIYRLFELDRRRYFLGDD